MKIKLNPHAPSQFFENVSPGTVFSHGLTGPNFFLKTDVGTTVCLSTGDVLNTGPHAECYVFTQAVLFPFGEDQ